MGFFQDLAAGLSGAAAGSKFGPIGSIGGGLLGFLGAASQKSPANPAIGAAGQFFQQQTAAAAKANAALQALLPQVFNQAGYTYNPQTGAFAAQPFGNVYNTPRYQAFNAATIQPLEAQRQQQLAKLSAMKGQGVAQRGFGQNLINQNFAQGEAQANRQYGLDQQARQDQFLGMGLGALNGEIGAGFQGAQGQLGVGQYQQQRTDLSNQAGLQALTQTLGQYLHQSQMNRMANTSSDAFGATNPTLGQIAGASFGDPNAPFGGAPPGLIGQVQGSLGLGG